MKRHRGRDTSASPRGVGGPAWCKLAEKCFRIKSSFAVGIFTDSACLRGVCQSREPTQSKITWNNKKKVV